MQKDKGKFFTLRSPKEIKTKRRLLNHTKNCQKLPIDGEKLKLSPLIQYIWTYKMHSIKPQPDDFVLGRNQREMVSKVNETSSKKCKKLPDNDPRFVQKLLFILDLKLQGFYE